MSFTNVWDETTPADSALASTLGAALRRIKLDIRERMAVEHNFPATDTTQTGKHKSGSTRIYVQASTNDPGHDATNPGALWKQTDTGDLLYDSGTTWEDAPPPITGAVPLGVIVMWSGTLATIPSGWHLCDGTGSTPDLRDRFIVGTPAVTDPGGTGGATTHTHTLSVAAHTHSIAHSHTLAANNLTASLAAGTGVPVAVAADGHSHSLASSTSLSGSTTPSSSSSSGSSLPPYYKLAFIMKVA
jgi:hypothetical protein